MPTDPKADARYVMRLRAETSLDLTRRLIFVVGAALLLLSVSGPAAVARPLEHFNWHDISSEVITDFCGDLTVREDVDIRGMDLFNAHGRDGLAYFNSPSHGSVVWTNLANGKTFTSVFNIHDKDLKVTDNGDGTLTILGLSAGGGKTLGPDGKLLFSDAGQTRYEVLIDHGGTPSDPSDDEFLEFLGVVKESTGTNDTMGRDFCDDIHEFIG
jgi:hypothetical protein